MQQTFLYISLPLFCTNTTWNVQTLPSYTFYEGNAVCVLVHFFFSLPLIFTWVVANISHFLTPTFHGSSNKKCLLCFFLISALALSLFFSLSFAGLSPTFSFSIFQICGHDNLFKLNIACVAGGIVAVLCGCEIKVLPSNLTRLYYNGSAAKSHSTTTQYRQLRRLSLIL